VALTRRDLVAGAAATALAAGGVYELVDRLTRSPAREAPLVSRRREQHVLDGARVVHDNGVEVVVPPLHHQVLTGVVSVPASRAALVEAQRELEQALRRVEAQDEGLGVTVAWGVPYFDRYVRDVASRELPTDLRASRVQERRVLALTDAIRFPSDPEDTILDQNHLAILLRADNLELVDSAARDLLALELFRPTSIRKGFAGGGFEGGRSLPKKMALAAGISGAELIPDAAELFLGFTSTQKAGLGPPRIANLETLGYTDAAGGYFEGGTHMSLSHIHEDLEAWYINFDFRERVDTTFRPGIRAQRGTQTIPQGPDDVASVGQVHGDFRSRGQIGHSSSLQTTSRLQEDVRGSDGVLYRKGTAVPHRADFNTLDNPFFWSSDPERDGMAEGPAAGVHFVVFNPTSDDFNRTRLAMDGVLPDGTRLPFQPRARGQGLNSVLRTTHRQNFLVPPRRHRSFPLVELLPSSSK
jgi:hypothetical protein